MKFFRKLRAYFRKDKLDAEMAEEMRLHVELQTERNIAAGMSLDEARYAALRQFGNVASVQEQAREGRGWMWLEQGWQDVRYGGRALLRNPGFTATAMLTLALGIGANTAVFSLVQRLLLAPLPVRAPEELVVLERQNPLRPENTGLPYALLESLTGTDGVFTGVLARSRGVERVTVGLDTGGEAARGELVSGNYYEVLGVRPHIGRLLTAADDLTPGAHPVVVLSHAYWQQRFQGNPAVVGTTIHLTGLPMTVIGVSPPDFAGLDPGQQVDVRVPLAMQSELRGVRAAPDRPRGGADLQLVARLAEGVSPAGAEAFATNHWRHFLVATPLAGKPSQVHESEGIRLRSAARGYGQTRQRFQPALGALLAITSVVLFVACLNLAGLLLARAAARRHEFALRLALGAGRGRLVRQLLAEGLLLALGGAVLGGLLAVPGPPLLLRIMAGEGGVSAIATAPDGSVLLGLAAMAGFCGVVFGLAPAWYVGRTTLAPGLKADSRAAQGMRGKSALICAQVAAAVVVLTGAGLFLRTVHALQAVNPGFEVRNLLLAALSPKNAGRSDAEAQRIFREIRERVAALPGVSGATYAMVRALSGTDVLAAVVVEGTGSEETLPPVARSVVGPDYFTTFGLPLVTGRDFHAQDDTGAPKVAIVNEKFARLYFSGQDPLGRKIGAAHAEHTIIGVARDAQQASPRETAAPRWYVPYEQFPAAKYLDLCVRTTVEPEAMLTAVRRIIAEVDPGVALFEVRTQEAQLAHLLMTERTLAALASVFGVITAALALVGLYGLLAYLVAQQRRVLGIRLALGASPDRVLRTVLLEGLRLVIIGIAVGTPVAVILARLTANMLHGVTVADPITLGGVILLILSGALAACWLPARRAAKVDPVITLRAE